jgi:VWFA-related protein
MQVINRIRVRSAAARAVLLVLLMTAGGSPASVATLPQETGVGSPSFIPVDVVVVDRDGRFVEGLETTDFSLTVDGRPRRILGVRRVSRGPGAAGDAALRQGGSGTVVFAAEPVRNVLVIVDQSSLVRGEERTAVRAVGALLDRLGIDDRVAVVGLPATSTLQVELTSDRPTVREALNTLAGQATNRVTAIEAAGAAAEGIRDIDTERVRTGDPETARTEPPLPAVVAEAPALPGEAEAGMSGDTLADLLRLLHALRPMPGRKVVALFSEGLPPASSQQMNMVAAAASAAHVVVHGFGLPASLPNAATGRDPASVAALAKATGGAYAMVGRNAARDVERSAAHLTACYVLAVEAHEHDDAKPAALRVEVTRKGLSIYAPALLLDRSDAGDMVPAAEPPPAAGEPQEAAASRGTRAGTLVARPSPRDADLPLAMARLLDYVAGYEKQYSALVAEEDYRQAARNERVNLRSDFLLVKAQDTDDWVSFRDVFSVNGQPVRDREDRLKRLFLDPSPDAAERLMTIKDESARYNIGTVARNINVPLFPLRFLTPENRRRCQFRLAGTREAHGAQAWRIEFVERDRPTLIDDGSGRMDSPATGWFLVERTTGAIVETGMEVSREGYGVEVIVTFRREPLLGLWVPERMNETYRERVAGDGPLQWTTTLRGEASYSNFRRFQVKAEVSK